MGGSTRLKQEEIVEANVQFLERFAAKTKELKNKLSAPVPHISEDFKEYEGFFVRDKAFFQLKTKSKDRDKQRYEFVRYAFNIFPVPVFMFRAWQIPQRPKYYKTGTAYFETKEDYRLWYICMATGGSFYKEYGHTLFTKKESHTFLNCKHDLNIDQTIVYSIAYTESQHMGKSLRIAKSKISEFNLIDSYWKEVVKFFARLEPNSKEIIDDIVDYIVYKKRENPEFTIIGKGHTLESLLKKVEHWHQDLRRLKIIGNSVWEGISVKDREYSKKNSDGSHDYWKFTQIKTAKDLQKEGNAMRHCVLGYKSRCVSGECSIWSVSFNETRKLTIEVRTRDKAVIQVRGLANRIARPAEENVVRQWAKDSGLYF